MPWHVLASPTQYPISPDNLRRVLQDCGSYYIDRDALGVWLCFERAPEVWSWREWIGERVVGILEASR